MNEKSTLFSPALEDLIATVRDFLKYGGTGYEMQVARYLLDMSLREMAQGPALAIRSKERMRRLLDGEPATAEHLCESIRAGRFDQRLEVLLGVLLEEAEERVSIVRPDVLAPRGVQGT
jgi:hypothetical protein